MRAARRARALGRPRTHSASGAFLRLGGGARWGLSASRGAVANGASLVAFGVNRLDLTDC